MRPLAAVVFLGVLSAWLPVFAETWRTKVALMEAASRSNCVDADVSRLFYDLTVTGSELSIKANSGETFSAPGAPDCFVPPPSPDPFNKKHSPPTLLGTVTPQTFKHSTSGTHAGSSSYQCDRAWRSPTSP